MIITSICGPICTPIAEPVGAGLRWAYNMDGIDDRWTLANRAINPDGDIDIEFYSPIDAVQRTIIAQNISTTPANVEFQLFISGSTGNLGLNIGGAVVAAANAGTFLAGEKLRLTLSGASLNVYKASGALVKATTYTRGLAREPLAVTSVGARTSGAAGVYSEYFRGLQYNVKINGTLWPMADRNQAVQPSIPAGNNMTGANLNPDRWVEIPK